MATYKYTPIIIHTSVIDALYRMIYYVKQKEVINSRKIHELILCRGIAKASIFKHFYRVINQFIICLSLNNPSSLRFSLTSLTNLINSHFMSARELIIKNSVRNRLINW